MVRTIQAETITQEVAQMCKEAAYYLPGDVFAASRKRQAQRTVSGRPRRARPDHSRMPKSLRRKTDQSAKIQA